MNIKAELKPPVEERYREELAALAALDAGPRPRGWRLSPGPCGPLSWAAGSRLCGTESRLQLRKNTWATTPWWSDASSPWQEAGG